MSWVEKIKAVFKNSTEENVGTANGIVYINIPETYYIKEMAIYCATSIIANAISQIEVKTYEHGAAVKKSDYYSLNVRANPNESASQFWHKVAEKMLRSESGKGALCFVSGGNIYCADSYILEQKRPFLGNVYSGIIIDDFQMNRKFTADEVFLFKLENIQANKIIDGMYNEYDQIISTAISAYKDTNIQQYVLNVEGVQAGDKQFAEEWEKILKDNLKKFVDKDAKIYVQYSGRELKQMKQENNQKSSEDVTKVIEQIFSIVGKAYHIPQSLMLGNITNMNEVVKVLLTFAVDPIADMIGKELSAKRGYAEFLAGYGYKVDTSKVNHIDVFEMADKIDKLISSAFASIDEVREKADMDPLNEEWSSKHILTKNYDFIEEKLEAIGGNESAKWKNDDEI